MTTNVLNPNLIGQTASPLLNLLTAGRLTAFLNVELSDESETLQATPTAEHQLVGEFTLVIELGLQ